MLESATETPAAAHTQCVHDSGPEPEEYLESPAGRGNDVSGLASTDAGT